MGFGSYLKDYLEYYNISQKEFANRLLITPKHLNEILNKNIDISNELLIAISLITDINIDFILKIEYNTKIRKYINEKFKTEVEIKPYLKFFECKNLEKLGWVDFKDIENVYQNIIDIFSFLRIRNFDSLDKLINNTLYKKKDNANSIKLALWIARCDQIAKKQNVNEYKAGNLDLILNELKLEQMGKFNINNLIKIFNKYGCYLVIEDSLPSTKVRGCFKVKGDKPAI